MNNSTTYSTFNPPALPQGEIKEIEGPYTLLQEDNGKTLLFTGATLDSENGDSIFVPDGLILPYSVTFIDESNITHPQVLGSTSVTVRNRQSLLRSAGQYAVFALIMTYADSEGILAGDLTSV